MKNIKINNVPSNIKARATDISTNEYKESINPILILVGAIGIFLLIKGKKL
jgi:hypothetical protein